MIYFDVTKSGSARHQSGLMRVSARLREELGAHATPVRWEARRGAWLVAGGRTPAPLSRDDWLFTAELFCEEERPGFWRFLRARPCRLAAMFHDAIPLRHPQISWPQSVARQPEYMKMLSAFDRVWAISEASRRDLVEFWRWQGGTVRAVVETIMLGADFDRQPRMAPPSDPPVAQLLCVGILEPRKNQLFLLDVCEALWTAGVSFDLHVIGRVNPHFGRPVIARLQAMRKTQPRAHYYEAASDGLLDRLYTVARVTAFPTLAEGCGLPVMESLWKGRMPVVAWSLRPTTGRLGLARCERCSPMMSHGGDWPLKRAPVCCRHGRTRRARCWREWAESWRSVSVSDLLTSNTQPSPPCHSPYEISRLTEQRRLFFTAGNRSAAPASGSRLRVPPHKWTRS